MSEILDRPVAANPAVRFLWLLPVAVAVLAFLLTLRHAPERAWGALLIANIFFLTLALGALFFVALNHLVAAGWWSAIRRIPEAQAAALPWMALPMLGLLFGLHHLYHWSHADAVAHDPLLQGKAAYLNVPFFTARLLVILGIWVLFCRLLVRSATTDRRRLVRRSGLFVVVFALTFSIASFDWLMSLDPHWFSTIFAVYAFAGLFQGAIAAIIIAVVALRAPLRRAGLLREEHFHDLGKLLFAFSTFWAYIWLSQYLLIWYSHLPEEITYYVQRTQGPWSGWFFANLVLNWGIPFLVLMTRASKRNWRILVTVAGIVLVGRWIDLFVHVMPTLGFAPRVGLPEVLLFTGFLAFFVEVYRQRLARRPLEATEDPYLAESLSYHS